MTKPQELSPVLQRVSVFASFIFLLLNCTSGIYEVRVLVKGLSDDGELTLQNNSGDDLLVTDNGPFSFSNKFNTGDKYSVTVSKQPAGQVCKVTDGDGTIEKTNTAYIAVDCVDGFTVGGAISGQTGSLKLKNGSEEITVAQTATTFTFTTALENGAAYQITVSQTPSGQTCEVTGGDNGAGGGTISGTHDTSVIVTCSSGSTPAKIIFVTDAATETYNGNLGGISGADAKCMLSINKPSGGGTYNALLVDGSNRHACLTAGCSGGASENYNWVLHPNTKYTRRDSTPIGTTNASAIFNFSVTAGFTDIAGSVNYWSGLGANWGTATMNICNSWSDTAANGKVGKSDEVNSELISVTGSTACTTSLSLVCVEQ